MWTEDGPVACEVVKVVHDDRHEQVDYLHATKVNKAIVNSRPRPLGWLFPIFIAEQNLVGISSVMLVVFHRGLGRHTTFDRAIRPMWNNAVISKTGSITYRKVVRGGPSHGQATRTKIWWSSVVLFSNHASGETDKQTHSSQYFVVSVQGQLSK